MTSLRTVLLGVALAASGPRLAIGQTVAQSDSIRGAIEIVATRYILKQIGNEKDATIDPAYAKASDSPGAPTATRRSTARSALIAQAVNGTVASTRTAHGVHVILSNPVIRHDSASISVTGIYTKASTPPARAFQTVGLSLVRDHGEWAVVKAVPIVK